MSAEGRSGSTPPPEAAPSSDTAASAVAYSIATAKLYCDIGPLQAELSRLLGYPVMTHEMADEGMWAEARKRLEREFMEAWFHIHPPEGVQPGGDPDPDSGGSV